MLPVAALLLVEALVALLGSEDWRQRDAAESMLRRQGWQVRPALLRGERHPDAEVRSRCGKIREDIEGGVLAGFGEPLPAIDAAWFSLYVDGGGSRRGFYWPSGWPERYDRMAPYLDAVGRDNAPWENYRTATRLWLRAELAAGTDPDELHQLVNEMRRRDAVFLGWPAPMPSADGGGKD